MAAIRRIITVALALLGLTLCGCAGRDAEWIGTWEGTMQLADPSIPEDSVTRTINMVRLKINPDGTFSLMLGGATTTGDHRLNGDKATLKIKKFMDQPIEDHGEGAVKMNKDIIVEMQEDGTALLIDEFYDEPVVLTKVTQPEDG